MGNRAAEPPRGHWQTVYDANSYPIRMEWVWDVEPAEEWLEAELERRKAVRQSEAE
jgi:hypothetical protein